ncbi:MAG: glutathione metabolism protein [Rhizobiales bacterium]|nr:glutathione metabolism protein [Hyphomicrobiales bacterium]
MPAVTSIYAGGLAVLYLVLSINVIRMRRGEHIGFGHGNNQKLERAIRAHANFAEYTPLIILLIFLCEMQNLAAIWLHLLGGLLVTGRLIHAYGLNQTPEMRGTRTVGLTLTFLSLLGAGISAFAMGTATLVSG